MLDEFNAWGHFLPRETAARLLIALVEQGPHKFRVELAFARHFKVRRDSRQVEVQLVGLRNQVDAVEVAKALGVNQRADSAASNGDELRLHGLPFRAELRVAHEIEPALAGPNHFHQAAQEHRPEDLGHHPAVGVHLIEVFSAGFHIEIDRGKSDWYRGGCEQHLAEQVERVRVPAGRDGPHVPHDRASGVEVGGADVETPALAILGRDGFEAGLVNLFGDEIGQRRRAHHGIADLENPEKPAFLENVLVGNAGVIMLQLWVTGHAEKGVGTHERAGADARDDVKLRPDARRRPTAEQPRSKRAVRAAAGEREQGQRTTAARHPRGGVGKRAVNQPQVHFEWMQEHPHAGQPVDLCLLNLRGRDRLARAQRTAAAEEHEEKQEEWQVVRGEGQVEGYKLQVAGRRLQREGMVLSEQ